MEAAERTATEVTSSAGDQEKLAQDKTRLKVLHQRYREFSKDAGLRTQYERTEVAGFGEKVRSGGQNASQGATAPLGIPIQIGTVDFSDEKVVLDRLYAAERETVGLDYEVNHTVTSDGKIWRVVGDSGSVDPSGIPSSLACSYSYHNHPAKKTWFSFSAADVRFFFQSGAEYSKASDYLYEYVIRRTPETLAASPDMVYHRFKEIEDTDVFEMKWKEIIDPDRDSYHEVMKILSRELKFYYERKEKA